MVDYTADNPLATQDPETSCPYGAFSEVSALMAYLIMKVSDEKRGDVAFPRDYYWVCLISRELGFIQPTSDPEKTVFADKGRNLLSGLDLGMV